MKSNKREKNLELISDDKGRIRKVLIKDDTNYSISIEYQEKTLKNWTVMAKSMGDKLFDIIEKLKRYSFGIGTGIAIGRFIKGHTFDLSNGISIVAENGGKTVFDRAEESIKKIIYSKDSLDLIVEIAAFHNIPVDIKILIDKKIDHALLIIPIVLGISEKYFDQMLKSTVITPAIKQSNYAA